MMKNNWYVLTGAPSSGKTTVLKELEKKGFRIIDELARTFIDQEIKKGKKLQEIRKNELIFQKKILQLKINLEKNLSRKEVIFFERGIPDSFAYYKICGVKNDKFLKEAMQHSSYKKIFLLELFNYKNDYARIENEKKAKRLEDLLEKSYKKLNLPILRVPKMKINKRTEFILKNL